MNRLNLLPPDIKAEINYAKKNAQLVKRLTAFLALLFVLIAFFTVVLFVIKNEKDIVQVEKTAAQGLVDQKSVIEKDSNDLTERLTLIKKLKKERTDWSDILTKLAGFTPAGLQIQSLDITNNSKNRAKITGVAQTDKDIVLFKDLLTGSKIFTFVDIETIAEGSDPTASDRSTKTFTISLTLANSGVVK